MDGPPSRRRPQQNKTAPSADDAALGVVVTTARVAAAAARFFARAPGARPLLRRSAATGRAARAQSRERIESAAQSALSAPEVGRLVDGALAGPLPDVVARSSVEHHVGDRLVQQLLDSPEFDRALERALSSPKVREALARQTRGAAAELADDVHARGAVLDRKLSFGSARETVHFAGAASRALAFAIDLVLAHVAFLVGAAVVGLVVSLVGELRPAWVFGALAGSGWLLLVGAYFVFFWTLGGQTVGMRILRLRLTDAHGGTPTTLRAVVRFVALLLAIVPMFAGFLPILFDRRRRGFHDFVAGTAVSYVD